ncbi:hypothetical protein K474DRAFT_1771352 [Panus rudis PR-1116 ss-1]|nr:hypothetical protein K474DRAFT_1771352 [Panus rudis PR-1116 ss-1]
MRTMRQRIIDLHAQLVAILKTPRARQILRILSNVLIAAAIAAAIYGLVYLLLYLIGFGSAGVIGGSLAAWIQSIFYGAFVPAGSIFAILQSISMTASIGGFLTTVAALTPPIYVLMSFLRG